jgi:outer membrane protein assembly factor BamE (lipoprotein component of BamABCDE complex)
MKLNPIFLIILAGIALALSACNTPDYKPSIEPNAKNPLTHGNVQLNLQKGVTTQAQVLQVFGAPNITTIDSNGHEIWTYQRAATVSEAGSTSSGSFVWLIVLSGESQSSKSGFEHSSRTMTLIIKFDEHHVVSDFNSMSSSF